jgi:uncharacterized protein (TIGR02594 family)
MSSSIAEVQSMLAGKGLYHDKVDGAWGPHTQAAYDAYQRSLGHRIPPWLLVAERELGVAEVPGDRANSRILLYHQHTSLYAKSDEVPWCSSFANFCMDEVSIAGTNSAGARSWTNWGTELDILQYGAVVVFQRGSANSGLGHVAFALHWTQDLVICLGGNQGDCVSVVPHDRSSLIAKRWPTAAQLARATASLVTEPRKI